MGLFWRMEIFGIIEYQEKLVLEEPLFAQKCLVQVNVMKEREVVDDQVVMSGSQYLGNVK